MNLTQEQLKNLLAFLNRVQLQGSEAEVLVQIKIEIFKGLEVKPEVPARTPIGEVKEDTKRT